MGPQPELLRLFAGTFAVLVVASVAGWALRHYVARGEPHAAIDNFRERVGWSIPIATDHYGSFNVENNATSSAAA